MPFASAKPVDPHGAVARPVRVSPTWHLYDARTIAGYTVTTCGRGECIRAAAAWVSAELGGDAQPAAFPTEDAPDE
jgi:hypothetical protein